MSRRLLGASLALAVLLAGCKSSGIALNPPNGGNVVTLVISGTPTIAYQDTLHGGWKLLPRGQTQFTVTSGTAYGVAFTCPLDDLISESKGQRSPQEESWQPTVVIQATTSEFNVVPVPCDQENESTAELSGNVDATAISNTSNWGVDYDYYNSGNTGSYSFDTTPGTQDVFGFAYDDSDNVLAVKTIPSVNVPSGSDTVQNITFSASDAVGNSKSVNWTNAPEGNSTDTWVDFGDFNISPELAYSNDTSVSYPTVASGDIASDDGYIAGSETYYENEDSEGYTEAGVFNASLPASIAYPNVWNAGNPTDDPQPKFTLNYSGFAGLTGGVGAYAFSNAWGTEEDQEGWTFAFVTFGYVHAAHISSYAPPNITLTGFSDMQASDGDIFPYGEAAFYGTPAILLSQFYYIGFLSSGQRGAQSLHSSVPSSWSQPQVESAQSRPLLGGVRTLSSSSETEPTSGIFDLSGMVSCIVIGSGATCEE